MLGLQLRVTIKYIKFDDNMIICDNNIQIMSNGILCNQSSKRTVFQSMRCENACGNET